jgi:hypothetical protein
MARPKAATPAAHIRSVLRFFETANQELADVAFELVRAALAERKARKKPVEKPKTRETRETHVTVQALAVPDAPVAAQTTTAAHPTPPTATPPAPPAQAAAPPAGKKRMPPKKKPTGGAGKKRGGPNPTTTLTTTTGSRASGSATTEALPEQHPVEEQAEPPDQSELRW